MIKDYPDLIAEVSHRSGRGDVANRAGMYVGMAEKMLSRRLRLTDMITDAELTTNSSGLAELPEGCQELISVTVRGDRLERRPLAALLDGTRAGYSVQARSLKSSVRQSPHQIVYFDAVPSLETHNVTWLLDREPELYLQAVLFQVHTGSNAIEQAQATAGYLAGLIDDANSADSKLRHAGTIVTLGRNTP